MTISGTSNYMSNHDILAWMETKTDGLYTNMTDAMQASDAQSDCESQLNKIKTDIANAKINGGDAAAIHDEVNAALAKYGDVPGVKDALQPIADKLNAGYGTAEPVAGKNGVGFTPPSTTVSVSEADWSAAQHGHPWGITPSVGPPYTLTYTTPTTTPKTVKLNGDEIDAWTKSISNTVDDLGKKDQLALINIQEINSEINQAKQTASALMDSADKSANSIINHIG